MNSKLNNRARAARIVKQGFSNLKTAEKIIVFTTFFLGLLLLLLSSCTKVEKTHCNHLHVDERTYYIIEQNKDTWELMASEIEFRSRVIQLTASYKKNHKQ